MIADDFNSLIPDRNIFAMLTTLVELCDGSTK